MTIPRLAISRRCVIDLALAAALAVIAASGSHLAIRQTGLSIRQPVMGDVWFDADAPRVAESMADRWSDRHQRAQVHPLFPLTTIPVYALRALGASRDDAVSAVVEGIAAAWGATLFLLLRLMGCEPLDAALLTGLGLASATGVFWLGIPESFALGSVTVMLALAPAAVTGKRPREGWFCAASAASLAITTTNWTAGLAATVVTHRPRRAVQVTLNALTAVVLVWAAQKFIVPEAGFFLGPIAGEERFLFRPTPARVTAVVRQAVAGSMIAPPPAPTERAPRLPDGSLGSGTGLTMQQAGAVGGPVQVIGILLWLAILGLGGAEAWARRRTSSLPLVLALFLGGQLFFHLAYGKETFLYAMDYLPGMLLVAAFGLLGTRRRLVRGMAAMLVVVAAASNVPIFARSAGFVRNEAVRMVHSGLPPVAPSVIR